MTERRPAEVFPPGNYLRDELEARGWTQTEFAEIIGRPPRLINEIIAGKRAISAETARAFSDAFGTSAQFWLNLESAYQLWKMGPSLDEGIAKQAKLRERFPVREMIKRGWVEKSENFAVVEKRVLDFFELESVDDPISFAHAARKKNVGDDLNNVQFAWLYRVKQMAQSVHVPKYSEKKLRDALPRLERLMTEPEEIRHIPAILAECGVRLVVVEPIPGSEINGVCFWLDDNSPVIGLTLKGDHIDRFWFNLRHEIEHVLRGDGKEAAMLDDFDGEDTTSEAELAADAAAADFCVPTKAMESFVARHHPMYSEVSLLGFSRLVQRHPGIVAGQIQKRTNKWSLFKKYCVAVRSIFIQTALTDGYGREAHI